MSPYHTIEIVCHKDVSETVERVLLCLFDGMHYGEHHKLFRVYYAAHQQLTCDDIQILRALKDRGLIITFETMQDK